MSYEIIVEGGMKVKLPTAGKYCDRDIIITAEGKDPALQEKSVTPTESAQAVTPDSGYDGLVKVNVGEIPNAYEDVAAETAAYTAELSDLATQISALETALEGKAAGGSGSGGGSVETCTVTNQCEDGMTVYYVDSNHSVQTSVVSSGGYLYGVAKNSIFIFMSSFAHIADIGTGDYEYICDCNTPAMEGQAIIIKSDLTIV